eukprot:CAMPEP_0204900496 /NCGR_PEP_ID=MMETSP1397-20131031/2511_1 /ASSEMBLY_ACC=CAM_ASM_000891 /TAXON_ID=49980 /ORGANISM="Climacostomum Climacostomum virens, Strain Stock W-24" /LENGTH=97 /DNA_ID=CAMNT_0052068659 /DNA_START=81 /DNA_END=374 /DNA_ORIENTATION=+
MRCVNFSAQGATPSITFNQTLGSLVVRDARTSFEIFLLTLKLVAKLDQGRLEEQNDMLQAISSSPLQPTEQIPPQHAGSQLQGSRVGPELIKTTTLK